MWRTRAWRVVTELTSPEGQNADAQTDASTDGGLDDDRVGHRQRLVLVWRT
jgi:hypothetical protein